MSKFLLNRQKIVNPTGINAAISSHLSHIAEQPPKSAAEFFYRLEWYKIGISVPFIVYSQTAPVMRVMPECQLLETKQLEPLEDQKYFDFSLFAVPPFKHDWDPATDEKKIVAWLKKELTGAATLLDQRFGPNNRIYYEVEGEHRQQQTVTITGTLQAQDIKKLDLIRRFPLGKYSELGCGLLYLQARCEYADRMCCRK
ncbi:MAG: hypothetical protein KKB51_18880 [Candidatus Riflebacteria bacterium]|nr:hypothetical protein [Candidatus Riflebacteria bacterium]